MQYQQVDKWRFQEVIQRLELLNTKIQLDAVLQDFTHLSNPQLVCYDDFCSVLDSESRALASKNGINGGGSLRGSRSAPDYDSGGDSSALAPSNVDRWYSQEASPKQRKEFSNLYDSLRAFKSAQNDDHVRGSMSLDPGSDGPGLFPPRVSDSLSFTRSLPYPPASRYGSNQRDSWDRDRDVYRSQEREVIHASGRSSPVPPRTSPSKVGSKMWGRSTSLEEKGRPLKIDDGLWCCAVCLYTENPAHAMKCVICDSANYSKRKDYQVKEQCRNCTFLNGGLAIECEMCGMKM